MRGPGYALLMFATVAALPARADCEKDGLSLFPAPGAIVPTNTRFILEGFGKDQGAVSGLVGQSLTLSAEGDTVSVKVQKGWRSAMNQVAVLLRPSRTLKPNLDYTLKLPTALAELTLTNAMPTRGPVWRTGRTGDTRSPAWEERPTVSEGEYIFKERELTRHIKLRMTLQEDSPSFLLLTMRRLRGAVGIQTYFVPINGGEAQIGHDGCHGSFGFEDGGAYRAKVEVFDSAGNTTRQQAEVEFLAPAPAAQ